MTDYLFPPAPVYSLPVRGSSQRYAVGRIFCVGRNYHAHAIEMGRPVDKATGKPFYFTKTPSALVDSGATVPYPCGTANYHYEMELVLAIGRAGFRVKEEEADAMVYGWAAGLDMTRRDLQLVARDQGRPWDLGKDFELSAVCSELVPASAALSVDAVSRLPIHLEVNGQTKQAANTNQLIWNVREIIADLSLYYHLQPGDLIYTGTPEGVGAVQVGDRITGAVDGLATVTLTIGAAE